MKKRLKLINGKVWEVFKTLVHIVFVTISTMSLIILMIYFFSKFDLSTIFG